MQILKTTAKNVRSDVDELYNDWDYKSKVPDEDIVILARDDQKAVGIVRLVFENDLFLLRGMYVLRGKQRSGVGKKMIQMFEDVLVQKDVDCCYLVCGAHLEQFYGFIGFQKLSEENSPIFLNERAKSYESIHGPQIVMKRI